MHGHATSSPTTSPAVTTIATGLAIPWGIAFLPDGTALVTERGFDEAEHPPALPPRILSIDKDGKQTEVMRMKTFHAISSGEGVRARGVGNDPKYTNPIATRTPTKVASPSGIAILGNSIYVACLAGQRLYRVGLDGKGSRALLTDEYGRLRSVAAAPDGSLWILTSNRDGRGRPVPTDDRILRLVP